MTDIEWLQYLYRERGFIVFACDDPKVIGEILNPEEDYDCLWQVVGGAYLYEFAEQVRSTDHPALKREWFYRCVAMD